MQNQIEIKVTLLSYEYLQFSVFCKDQNSGIIKLFQAACVPEF